MGKRDAVGKKYFANKKRFADLMNAFLFNGKQVVVSQKLRELDPNEMIYLEWGVTKRNKPSREDEAIQKVRDILKEAVINYDGHCCYVLLGVENQTDLYYAMPVRNLVYDGLRYLSEVHAIGKRNKESGKLKECKDPGAFTSMFLKDDKLTPIVTVVVYWGADEWTAPRSLRELFPADTPKEILQYTPDFTIPVLAPKEIKDFSVFQTEVGDVFQIIAASDDKDAFRQFVNNYLHDKPLDAESVQTLNAFLGTSIPVEEEEVDMCKAIEDIRNEGEVIGTAKGEAKLARLITAMSEQGDSAKIAQAAADPEFRTKMYEKYGIK